MKMAERRASKVMEPTVNETLLVCKNFKDEEKMRIKSNGDDQDTILLNNKAGDAEMEDNGFNRYSPIGSDWAIDKQEDQLKSAKVEMGEVREENERLKLLLSKMMKDYQSLQMHFHAIVDRKEQAKKSPSTAPPTDEESEESEVLVSLSLGRDSSFDLPKKDEKKICNLSRDGEKDEFDGGLELGLGCRFNPSCSVEVSKNPTSPENSFGEEKEEEGNEKWSPGTGLKMVRSGDDDVLQQNSLKKARVSVRVVCDTPTMIDGCQWRKYGQKIAKGNPCPRAYYRCTISPSCPVRKQVQRCADNMSILITTYEGTHNHQLPAAAAAMASATSAAAAMLKSPSSTSQPVPGTSTPTTASAAVANLHGLNFTLTTTGPTPHPSFYFPNSSLSTSHSHPTITLDLTAPPPAAASHFTRLTSSFPSLPRFSSSCLDFSSSSSSSSSSSFSWGHGYLGYGTVISGDRTHVGSSYYRNHLLKNHQNAPPPPPPSLTETVDTATKAITSNPDFRSALEAALTSLVGNGAGAVDLENQGGGPNSRENAKWRYLNGLPSLISRQGRSSLLPSSLQISTSQNSSLSSPAENVDRIK